MTDESRPNATNIIHEIPYLRLFPWLRLFSAPRYAAGPSRLILATFGVALTLAGWTALDLAFPNAEPLAPRLTSGAPALEQIEWSPVIPLLTEPARVVYVPFVQMLQSSDTVQNFLHATLASLWTVIVWSLIGGAIARMAVLHLTRGERLGIRDALRFSVRKTGRLLGAPLVPLLGFSVFAGGIAIFGLLYRIPGGVGATVAGLLAFVPLLVGVLLTLIMGGLALGFPLMPPAVAAESEDGFDAMSRSYAYVQQRPWHYALYILLAGVIGGIGLNVAKLFATLTIGFTIFALSFGGGGETVQAFYSLRGHDTPGLAGQIHIDWMVLIVWLVRGWIYSYFWTAFSAIYLLLRRDVDGMPWSKVAVESMMVKTEEAPKPEGETNP